MVVPNNSSHLTTMQDLYAQKVFLNRGQPYYILDAIGQPPQSINMHGTRTAKWRRYERMAAITTPLEEGVTPAGSQFQFTDITATLDQYGNWAPITDVVLDTNDDQPAAIKEWVGVMGEQGAESMERVGWATAVGGTSVEFQNGTARTDVNTAPTRAKLRKICATLETSYGKNITKITKASSTYNSVSIEPAYIAVCHTNAAWHAIRDLDGYKDCSDYAGGKFHPSEFGTVEGLRFLRTQLIPTYADGGDTTGAMESDTGVNANVYVTMVFARECFGCVPLKGRKAIDVIWRNPEATIADPLAQRGFTSWKTYRTYVRLNEAWMIRWEHAIPAS